MDQRKIGQTPGSSSIPSSWLQPRTILIGLVALIVLISAWLAAFNTQAGTVDIVLRWGAPVRVTEPGLNFKIPFVETRHTVELRERAFTKTYESASRDPMELNVSVRSSRSERPGEVEVPAVSVGTLAMKGRVN